MLNKVMIIGRLGRDPEIKNMQGGNTICNFTVATDESYVGRDGNKVEKTEWHRIGVYGKQAENCGKYLAKGSLVFVEGKLRTRMWQDQSGQQRSVTEIAADRVQFLDRKQQDAAPDRAAASYPQRTQQSAQQQDFSDIDFPPF